MSISYQAVLSVSRSNVLRLGGSGCNCKGGFDLVLGHSVAPSALGGILRLRWASGRLGRLRAVLPAVRFRPEAALQAEH